MTNKIKWAGLWLAFSLMFTGCKTAPTPGQLGGAELAAQVITSGIAALRPQYLPAVQGALAQICSLSTNTAATTSQLQSALYNLGVGGKFGTIIEGNVQGAFNLLQKQMLLNTNSTAIMQYSEAICKGGNNGLALAASK